MSKSENNINDIKFILERVIWYLKQPFGTLIEYFKENKLDAFYSLPHPEGGMLICGLEANKRFESISKRFLSTQKEKKHKTDISKFTNELKNEFVDRFILKQQEICQRNVDRMIASSYKRVAINFKAIRHFIPCSIFKTSKPSIFKVGPVEFLHKSQFFMKYEKEIEARREEIAKEHRERCQLVIKEGMPAGRVATTEQSKKLGNRLVDGLREFYDQYDWFSVVDITECDPIISYDKALFTTRAALNILKLLLGVQYTDKIRTAYDSGISNKSAKLSKPLNEKIHISLAIGYNGNIPGDKWYEAIIEKGGYFFNLAALALTYCNNFDNIPPLSIRFIDALSWYGDGISERVPAAQVIKLVSSIERMTGTGKENEDGNKRGVTDIVTKRSAILYHHATEESFESCLEEIKKIYDCRSNLVHGTISPFDDQVVAIAYKATEMTRMILLQGLEFFNFIGLDKMDLSQKDLRTYYSHLEKGYFGKRNIEEAANKITRTE